MAARTDLLEVIRRLIHGSGKAGMPVAGVLPDAAFQDLQRLNPQYLNPELLLSRHSAVTRFQNPNDGWSEERIADAIGQLLESEKTRGMPNFAGGNRFAKEALLAPNDPLYLVGPTAPAFGGRASLVTLFEESPEKIVREMKKLTGRQGGGHSPIPGNHPQEDAVSQLGRLSAVGAQSVDEIIRQLTKGVKAAAPVAATGGLLGMAGPDEAQAATWRPEAEPGLEAPWFDPVDMLTAPVGVAGAGAKALSAAAAPFAGGAINGLLSLF